MKKKDWKRLKRIRSSYEHYKSLLTSDEAFYLKLQAQKNIDNPYSNEGELKWKEIFVLDASIKISREEDKYRFEELFGVFGLGYLDNEGYFLWHKIIGQSSKTNRSLSNQELDNIIQARYKPNIESVVSMNRWLERSFTQENKLAESIKKFIETPEFRKIQDQISREKEEFRKTAEIRKIATRHTRNEYTCAEVVFYIVIGIIILGIMILVSMLNGDNSSGVPIDWR